MQCSDKRVMLDKFDLKDFSVLAALVILITVNEYLHGLWFVLIGHFTK